MAIFLIIRSILAAENKRRDAEPQSKEMFDNAYVEQPSADGTMVKVKVDWVGLTIKLVCVELNCIRPGILGLDGQTKPRFQICVVMDPLSNAPMNVFRFMPYLFTLNQTWLLATPATTSDTG
jgi:hypothetical protein